MYLRNEPAKRAEEKTMEQSVPVITPKNGELFPGTVGGKSKIQWPKD